MSAPNYEEFECLPFVQRTFTGTRRTYSIQKWVHGPDDAGRFWAAEVYVHGEHGVELDFGFAPYEVEQREVTAIRWVKRGGS